MPVKNRRVKRRATEAGYVYRRWWWESLQLLICTLTGSSTGGAIIGLSEESHVVVKVCAVAQGRVSVEYNCRQSFCSC